MTALVWAEHLSHLLRSDPVSILAVAAIPVLETTVRAGGPNAERVTGAYHPQGI
jgi:hypothetical protein